MAVFFLFLLSFIKGYKKNQYLLYLEERFNFLIKDSEWRKFLDSSLFHIRRGSLWFTASCFSIVSKCKSYSTTHPSQHFLYSTQRCLIVVADHSEDVHPAERKHLKPIFFLLYRLRKLLVCDNNEAIKWRNLSSFFIYKYISKSPFYYSAGSGRRLWKKLLTFPARSRNRNFTLSILVATKNDSSKELIKEEAGQD